MESILHTDRIFAILMASGFSKRFGDENKLLVPFRGKALARHTLDLVCEMRCFNGIFFVAADERVAALAEGLPVTVIHNAAPEKGQQESARLGVEAASAGAEHLPGGRRESSLLDYYIFFACDQPLLDAPTVRLILKARRPGRIVEPRVQNKQNNLVYQGSPCLFSATFRDELLSLGAYEHPRIIKIRHPGDVVELETANAPALEDIDTPEDLERIKKIYEKTDAKI